MDNSNVNQTPNPNTNTTPTPTQIPTPELGSSPQPQVSTATPSSTNPALSPTPPDNSAPLPQNPPDGGANTPKINKKMVNRAGLLMGLLILVGGLLVGGILVSRQQIFQQQAWNATQSAEAICLQDNKVGILVTFVNTEADSPENAMKVEVEDLQSGNKVDLGTIEPGNTKTDTIIVDANSVGDGQVRFNSTWADGRDGVDTRFADYSAKDCGQTQEAACNLSPGDNGILVNFSGEEIYADRGEGKTTVGQEIPAGTYKVTLRGYDNHSDRVDTGQGQLKEQYYLSLLKDSTEVAKSGNSDDIPEEEDYSTTVVNNNLVIPETATSVVAMHSHFPGPGPESLVPICALFEPVEETVELSCPLTPSANGILVNFNTEIYSDRGEDKAQTSVSQNVPAGSYKVTLASWDQHSLLEDSKKIQPAEQYYLKFSKNGSVIAQSNSIGDLPDEKDVISKEVNASLNISADVDTLIAYHSVYEDTSSPNSITPTCILLEPLGQPTPSPTPTPTVSTSPTPSPSPTPTATPPNNSACNTTCSQNNECNGENSSLVCSDGRCRHKDNLDDTGCNIPLTYSCNSDCSTDSQCATANSNYQCIAGNCRHKDSPTDTSCNPPVGGPEPTPNPVSETVNEVDLPEAGINEPTLSVLLFGGLFVLLGLGVILVP